MEKFALFDIVTQKHEMNIFVSINMQLNKIIYKNAMNEYNNVILNESI